jgi:hypothetical protein
MRGIASDLNCDEQVELLGTERREWLHGHAIRALIGSHRIARAAVPLAKFSAERDGFDRPGIYFLFVDGMIMYIGQSYGITGRVWTHRKERVFDAVAAIAGIPKWAQNDYEYAYIRAWTPVWNAEHRRGYPSEELTKVAEGLDSRFVLSADDYEGVRVTPTL